jgi:hypothetical protein
MSVIKSSLHIDTDTLAPEIRSLSPDNIAFINSLETLVRDGAPFDSFIESSKFDMKRYSSSESLMNFAKLHVRSISQLHRDGRTIGSSLFGTSSAESFWDKQKRKIKEGFLDAIQIKKTDDKATTVPSENEDDKTLFEKALKSLADGQLATASEMLENIQSKNKDINDLITCVQQRIKLDNAFCEFKKEFVSSENTSNKKDEGSLSSKESGVSDENTASSNPEGDAAGDDNGSPKAETEKPEDSSDKK